jgi:hypothetical protein
MLRERDADGHLALATEKLRARDGKACLSELDLHDTLDKRPEHTSTRPQSSVATIRGECLMLAGKCDEGKALLRKAYPAQVSTPLAPEQLETMLDAIGTQFCEGALSPRDQLLKAASNLQRGSTTKLDAKTCATSYETVKRLGPNVPPRSDDDALLKNAGSPFTQGYMAASCFGRAGDCTASRRAYDDAMAAIYKGKSPMNPAQAEEAFERAVPSCKGK